MSGRQYARADLLRRRGSRPIRIEVWDACGYQTLVHQIMPLLWDEKSSSAGLTMLLSFIGMLSAPELRNVTVSQSPQWTGRYVKFSGDTCTPGILVGTLSSFPLCLDMITLGTYSQFQQRCRRGCSVVSLLGGSMVPFSYGTKISETCDRLWH